MTYGVVMVTYKATVDMIPTLKEEEKAQIRAELAEWNLQENELDHEVVWIFDHYLFHEGIQR